MPKLITLENLARFKKNLDETIASNEGSVDTAYVDEKIAEINTALADKVDKVAGKVLSSNDFTDEEKDKLLNLSNYDDTELADRVTQNENALNKKVEFKDLEEVEFTPSLQTQINELESKVNDKANKDLSNVTYPSIIYNSSTEKFDGLAHTGSGDRVIETYISTDGLTWYRKWASGWKECGQIGITANNTYFFPIVFNYIPTFISTVVSTRNDASYDREKHINSLTNEQFTLPYLTAAGAVSFSYYACGY